MQYPLVILVTCLLGFAVGNPVAKLIRYSDDRDLNKYSYDFETDNGISRSESGEIKTENNEEVLSVSGSYKYSEDGKTYIVTYTADKNGYRPMFRIDEASPPESPLPQPSVILPTIILPQTTVPPSIVLPEATVPPPRGISSALLASVSSGFIG